MEELTRQPGEEDWSLGQMYQHLCNTALYMQIRGIEACKEGPGNPAVSGAAKSEAGASAFSMGSFPPIRIKVPASPQYTPGQPESKEKLRESFHTVLRRMRELEPDLAAIPAERTVAHPRLGGLNATEWFALVEMHYRHHLLQQERLVQFLADTQNSAPRTLA